MQAAAATFSATPLGHKFVMRKPLAMATANKCAECACDIREHARDEVTDAQLLEVLNCQDDGKASVVLQGELAVGSYKAALSVCKGAPGTSTCCVLNCAGQKLHDFLPTTRSEFDKLRQESPPRLVDLEWADTEDFNIPLDDVLTALSWMREQVAIGRMVLVNCAQGKSRSGTMAVAYVMAKLKLSVPEALARVRAARPLVEPNPTFLKALQAFAPDLHQQCMHAAPGVSSALHALFAKHDVDGSGGLSLDELRSVLVHQGSSANEAKTFLSTYDSDGRGELTVEAFVRAWLESGRGPPL